MVWNVGFDLTKRDTGRKTGRDTKPSKQKGASRF